MYKGQKSVRGGIEDILLPMDNFRCTQGDFEGNHPYYACDMAGKDSGRDVAYFPFTAVCKATNPSDGNAVWYQSKNKVRFADGTIDYCTIMILHDNDLNGVIVGREYPQGSQMAVEGSKMGNTYGKIGNHLHMEFAKGPFTQKYARNNKGYYLPNGQPIEKCCFADNTKFLTSGNWAWKYLKDVPVNESSLYTCNYNMKVRTGAGTNFACKKVSQLSTDGKKNATSTNGNDDAIYKQGTVFTAKRLINNVDSSVWAQSPSGYICIKDNKQVYCTKK